ncbi:DUF4054 domain-containing protein [Photorhabdus laumondii subsp. laumondii]|uniref:DUF4054 domain-containing protein n=1 Tax=Photorhabdus laumondii subsp. laumondii TaxID=141679 RepID=A0A6L9JUM4_PHOLM|nr:DUF4054 domain-containing protein [Photorhabdus laumondii]MCC8385311.1 DUF4054 domain-containing protein [Photorhabdus laumondii]MCC8414095.1 DUF4054 domain-containing protein [Photorhabdus laumondii]NDK96970.1 DUF4054 domain-containing protein [Photorhabdus laumondii subsp. laumondii]NDL23183.1 DUF4054 domain-containing protein [Photorhabdus laumondii subsp. laumondii]NDL32164.1 DUF4054 domain-containing protein [Photorhabdus laumondii subsp. laumondii]
MEVTAQIVTDFREYYPEFGNVDEWPDKSVIQALEEGNSETGKRWLKYNARPASIKKRGMFAFAAHQLVMRKRAINGDVGAAYAISSKSVGDESTSFAVPSVTSDELIINGNLPLTSYGLEFLRLRRRAGTGGMMI